MPYMVPILLGDPARQFAAFKQRGLPMWRWETSARGFCAVTDRYADALVQIPCHQSLSADELKQIQELLASGD